MKQKFKISWKTSSCEQAPRCLILDGWYQLSGAISALIEINAYDVVISIIED